MGLLYIIKQLICCIKIRVGFCLNSYETYHNTGCYSTSFTSMGDNDTFFFHIYNSKYLETVSALYIFLYFVKDIFFGNDMHFFFINSITEQV